MPGMIVAPQPIAVEAGARILMAGGNAVDAALACAFVQGVLDPHSCGLGGYALLTLHPAGGNRPTAMDAPATAGQGVTEDMWVDRLIRPNPDGWGYFLRGHVNDRGYTSVCTPGAVKGFGAMHSRWGSLGWADLIEPAAQVAEEGFTVLQTLANQWKRRAAYPEASSALDYVRSNPEARRIYLKADGTPHDMGDALRNPDYAASLRHLARHGYQDFYHGEMAERMARDLAANGSFVTADDLAGYELPESDAVLGTFHDYTVASAPPPHGGATLIAILNILEGYDLAAMGHNSPQYIYTVAMAMKAAFADRNPTMADPAFQQVPVEWMISKDRAAHWRDRIDRGDAFDVTFATSDGPHTTHVTVVDDAGTCVALTHSLGASSGVITPGLGYMYNNSMINFHPLPGHPNSMAPGKGRTTGMAPTLVYQRGKPILVLGSPGATRIITSNLQVILNRLVFGMSMTEAVHAPRFDCQGAQIRCHARIPGYVCDEIARRHPVVRIPQSHGGFALVHAIHIDPVDGTLSGGADTGADGMALLV